MIIIEGFEKARARLSRLNTEINKALQHPETLKVLDKVSVEPTGGTPEQFGAYMRDEFAKWGALVKETGMTAD